MSILDDVKNGMEESLTHLTGELRNLRSGRANPGMLDTVIVEAYGTPMKLKDLATVSNPEARQLLITPFDGSVAPAIAKGIEKANLGMLAAVDGNLLRVNVPPLTEEIRKEVVKQAKRKAEEAKVSIREQRKKGNDAVKKQKSDGDIAEDMQKKLEKQIQELTDTYCKKVDVLFTEKEKDLMSV